MYKEDLALNDDSGWYNKTNQIILMKIFCVASFLFFPNLFNFFQKDVINSQRITCFQHFERHFNFLADYESHMHLPIPPHVQDLMKGQCFQQSLTGLNLQLSFS